MKLKEWILIDSIDKRIKDWEYMKMSFLFSCHSMGDSDFQIHTYSRFLSSLPASRWVSRNLFIWCRCHELSHVQSLFCGALVNDWSPSFHCPGCNHQMSECRDQGGSYLPDLRSPPWAWLARVLGLIPDQGYMGCRFHPKSPLGHMWEGNQLITLLRWCFSLSSLSLFLSPFHSL